MVATVSYICTGNSCLLFHIHLNEDMAIQSTQCECPRGDHKCSHVAALYIYGIHNLSRTDVERQLKRKKSDLPTTSAAAEMFPNIPYRPLSRLPNEEDRSFL